MVAAIAAKKNPCHNEREMRKRMLRMHLASFDSEAYKTGGESRGIKSRRTMYLSPLQLEECFFYLFKTRSLLKIKAGLKSATEMALLILMRVFFENIKTIRKGAVKKAKSL